MARNKIICDGLTFTEEKIKSGSIFLSNSLAFDELGIDTLESELDLSEETGTIFAPKDYDGLTTKDNYLFTVAPYFHILSVDPNRFKYGKAVTYYRNEKVFGTFYMQSIKRVSEFYFAISCISAIGLLDTIQHYGGLYSGQSFETVVANIIRNAIPYSIAANVKNIAVYGWLPVATARDNLRQLLFATGVSIKKNNSGNVSFELLNTNVPSQIADNRIMLGGSVDFPAAASEVVVSEHSFFVSSVDETVTLYDGSATASTIVCPSGATRSGILVKFDEPIYNLAVSGAYILESGVNYAVLSGGGYAKLTGKKYAHTIREIQRTIPATSNSRVGNQNVARVDDATLVSLINSESVAERVASYYSSSRTIKAKILVETERPGDKVTFNNPFKESDTGIISSMDINMSGTLVADTEFVAGYTPTSGGTYQNRVLLINAGTFIVPAGITKIHVVLIGGGQGGYSGYKGKPGKVSSIKNEKVPNWNIRKVTMDVGEGGDGGAPGNGGGGGKIYQSTVYVTPGQAFYYSCGAGGAGGAPNLDRTTDNDYSSPGAAGGDTNFGSLSSANGSSSVYGYKDIFSGAVYGQSGGNGIYGGKGGGYSGNDSSIDAMQAVGPTLYYNGAAYVGGPNNTQTVSVGKSAIQSDGKTWEVNAGGTYGAGGGAAAGRNGNKATNAPSASATASANSFGRSAKAIGGCGGQGADALQPAGASVYGNGGTGGNGGGGEGGPGYVEVSTFISGAKGQDPGTPSNMILSQTTGMGRGLGSYGGTGAKGCILIYY